MNNELQKKLENLSEWEKKELSILQSRGWPVEVILFMFELLDRREEIKKMKWKDEKGYWHIDWDKRKKAILDIAQKYGLTHLRNIYLEYFSKRNAVGAVYQYRKGIYGVAYGYGSLILFTS
ncbi:hypothetical protein [Thermodesulfovibrio sp.]|uniref:hypothetical protein n=1 Tax=Thermodesulfovibrio sp. TaxID=2067987 RepID=UPI0030AA6345